MGEKERQTRTKVEIIHEHSSITELLERSKANSTSSDGDIKPCPFNTEGKLENDEPHSLKLGDNWQIECPCGARGPLKWTIEEAIEAWNKRAK